MGYSFQSFVLVLGGICINYSQQDEIAASVLVPCVWWRNHSLAVSSKMETVGDGRLSETLLQMMLRESIMKIRVNKGMLTYQHGSLKLILSILFLHAQLQQQSHSVLQAGFGEHEKEIFSNFAIIHDMTAADDQQPRPMYEEDRERNFDRKFFYYS